MHLTSRDGRKIYPFGQDLAHANHIVQQVDKKLRQMIDTYGPNGSASSKSADLQLSLESKLQTRLPTGGLTMFIKGWKRKATPSGRLYCQLAALARPTDETDCGLWPTCRASNAMNDDAETVRRNVAEKGYKARLEQAVALWATPSARDYKGMNDKQNTLKKIKEGKRAHMGQLPNQVMIYGKMQNGSTAQTERKGTLNPEFAFWLMGIPNEWASSIVQGMQSFRKSQRRSSKVRKKQ